ncbi:MAG TPA: AAA family ATPase [Acidimicrobiales bacterium]|nr:AAA family ATPase [Acidimicrobiales bacterium]
MAFKKAVRHAVKLKIGVQGPSGSGKTYGALMLARHMVGPEGKIAVIDTENGSASLYSDRTPFDVLDLTPPFTSKRYADAVAEAIEAGYDIIVIDSISPQWNGEGGILQRKEQLDAQGRGNSYTNWAAFSAEHTKFLQMIVDAPIHMIATLRSKSEYVVEQNEKGKAVPRKVGMAAVQREGAEYEFSIVFDVSMAHGAQTTKDRTGLFPTDEVVDLANKKTGKRITDWLASGVELPPVDLRPRLPGTAAKLGGYGGQAIADVPTEALETILKGFREVDPDKFSDIIETIGEELANRAGSGEV